jgi:hypothetical protein
VLKVCDLLKARASAGPDFYNQLACNNLYPRSGAELDNTDNIRDVLLDSELVLTGYPPWYKGIVDADGNGCAKCVVDGGVKVKRDEGNGGNESTLRGPPCCNQSSTSGGRSRTPLPRRRCLEVVLPWVVVLPFIVKGSEKLTVYPRDQVVIRNMHGSGWV